MTRNCCEIPSRSCTTGKGWPGALEIPMESFARAVEIMLKRSSEGASTRQHPDAALWDAAVKDCGYVQARLAIRKEVDWMARRVHLRG